MDKELYDLLHKEGMVTTDYNTFKARYADEASRVSLFSNMRNDGLYQKTQDDFFEEYYGVKKKPSQELSAPSVSSDTPSPTSTTPSSTQLPAYTWGSSGAEKIKSPTYAEGLKTTPGYASPEVTKEIVATNKAMSEDTARRTAIEKVRTKRNGDYAQTGDAFVSEYTKDQSEGRSLIEFFIPPEEGEATTREYKLRTDAIKADVLDLENGISALDDQILKGLGDDAWQKQEALVTQINGLASRLQPFEQNPPKTEKEINEYNDWAFQYGELVKQAQEFEEHPLVKERNQMAAAHDANITRVKQMLSDDRYQNVNEILGFAKERQAKADDPSILSQSVNLLMPSVAGGQQILANAYARGLAGIGRLANVAETLTTGDEKYGTFNVVQDFMMGLEDDIAMIQPTPTKFARPLRTKTANWKEFQVDIKGGKIEAIRDKAGRVVDKKISIADEEEILSLPAKSQFNGYALPYKIGTTLADAGIMIFGAGKVAAPLKGLVGANMASKIGVTASTVGQMINPLYEEGMKMFNDKEKASAYALKVSTLIGISSNLFGLEARMIGGKGFLDTILKSTPKGKMSPVMRAMGITKEGVGELIEESVIEPLIDSAVRIQMGQPGKKWDKDEFVETAIISFATGAIMGGATGDVRNSALHAATQNVDGYEKELRSQAEQGFIEIDELEIQKERTRVQKIANVMGVVEDPSVIGLVEEKVELETKKEKLEAAGLPAGKVEMQIETVNQEITKQLEDRKSTPAEDLVAAFTDYDNYGEATIDWDGVNEALTTPDNYGLSEDDVLEVRGMMGETIPKDQVAEEAMPDLVEEATTEPTQVVEDTPEETITEPTPALEEEKKMTLSDFEQIALDGDFLAFMDQATPEVFQELKDNYDPGNNMNVADKFSAELAFNRFSAEKLSSLPDVELTPVSDETFVRDFMDGGFKKVDGKKVALDSEGDFFSYKDKSGYRVAEGATGLPVSDYAKTEKEAIKSANKKIKDSEKLIPLDRTIQSQAKRNGLSPRYKEPSISPEIEEAVVESTQEAPIEAIESKAPIAPRDLSFEEQGGAVVQSLSKGEVITVAGKEYTVKTKTAKQTVLSGPDGAVTIKHGENQNYGSAPRGKQNKAEQLFRAIEGDLAVDFVNENNQFHEPSDSYRRLNDAVSAYNDSLVESDINTKIKEAKKEFKDSLNPPLGVIYDPAKHAEQMLDSYKKLVNLAKLYIQKGVKNVVEFAKAVNQRVRDVAAAWGEAKGLSGVEIQKAAFIDIDKWVSKKTKDFAKNAFKNWFTANGVLPKEVFRRDQKRMAAIDATVTKASYAARSLRDKIKSYSQEQKAELKELLGDIELTNDPNQPFNFKDGTPIPTEVIEDLLELRNQIDALSKEMVAIGAADGDLAAMIDDNINLYLNRAYRIHSDKNWIDKVQDMPAFNKAVAWFTGTQEKFIQTLNDKLATQQRYRAKAKTPEIEAFWDAKISALEARIAKEEARLADPRAAVVAIMREQEIDVKQNSRLGAMNLGILSRKKQIPQEIRELFGEYDDPVITAMTTVFKQVNLIENFKFLADVEKIGKGKFLFEAPTGEHTKKIAQSDSYSPLNEYYTTPEIAQAFSGEKDKIDGVVKWMGKIVSIPKYASTIGSVMSHANNFWSGMWFHLQNGHFNAAKEFGGAFKTVWADAYGDNKVYQAKMLEYIQAGIIDDGIAMGEMQDALDAYKSLYTEPEGMEAVTKKTGIRKVTSALEWAYKSEDRVHKIVGYELEKARYAKALGKDKNDPEIVALAASRVRDTYPTYSLISKNVQRLRAVPFIATFPSFPYEVLRTTKNNLKYAWEDMQNPATRSIGIRRAIGVSTAIALPYGISMMTRALAGLDDEDEDRIRMVAPYWDKNATMWFTNNGPEGASYIPFQRFVPIQQAIAPINALLNERSEDRFQDAVTQLFAPFMGLDMTTRSGMEAALNLSFETGDKIAAKDDPENEKARLKHALKMFLPGTYNSAVKIKESYSDNNPKQREPFNEWLSFFSGIRIQKLDYAKNFGFLSQDLFSDVRDDKGIFYKNNRLGIDETERATKAWETTFKKAGNYYEIYRGLGVDPSTLDATLKKSGFNKEQVKAIKSGMIPALKLKQ